jgi:hypothetical protein
LIIGEGRLFGAQRDRKDRRPGLLDDRQEDLFQQPVSLAARQGADRRPAATSTA